MLHQLEQAVADSLSMARNVASSAEGPHRLGPRLPRAVARDRAQHGRRGAGPDLETLKGLCEDLEEITASSPTRGSRPTSGASTPVLVDQLRNVHDALPRPSSGRSRPPRPPPQQAQLSPQELLRRERRSAQSAGLAVRLVGSAHAAATLRGDDARPERVFAYLADFTHTEEWDPGTVRTHRVSGDGGVGTTYANTSRFLGRETDLNLRWCCATSPTAWCSCAGATRP